MGYSGLESVADSDMAADLAGDIVDRMVSKLRKGMKVQDNCYNTDGCVNVALFFRDCVIPCDSYYCYDELRDVAFDCIKLLEKKVEDANNDDEWDDDSNRKYHLTEYRRMARELRKFVNKCY